MMNLCFTDLIIYRDLTNIDFQSYILLDKMLYDNNELFRLDPKCSKQSLRKIHIFWKKGYGIIYFVIAV